MIQGKGRVCKREYILGLTYDAAQCEKRGRALGRFRGCGHCEKVFVSICLHLLGQMEMTIAKMLFHHHLVRRSRKARDNTDCNSLPYLIKDGREVLKAHLKLD